MSILVRYFLQNMFTPFLAILGLSYSIFAFRQVFELIPILESASLNVFQFLWLLLLGMPLSVTLLIPLALVIAVYFTSYSLSLNSEYIAMQSLGISLKKLLGVVIMLAAVVGLLTTCLTLFINPIARYKLAKTQQTFLQNSYKLDFYPRSINLVGDNLIYFEDRKQDHMQNIVIKPVRSNMNLIVAERGQFNFMAGEGAFQVNLIDGLFLSGDAKRAIAHFFNTAVIPVKLPKTQTKIDTLLANEDKWGETKFLLTKHFGLLTLADFYQILSQIDYKEVIAKETLLELLSRIVPFFSCIAFALFAFSLGIINPRMPKSGNLLILFFGIMSYIQAMAIIRKSIESVGSSPFLILLPPAVFFGLGVMFFYFANINRHFNLYGLLRYLFKSIRLSLTIKR